MQSAFHGQASDRAWFFSELLFQSVAAKKKKKPRQCAAGAAGACAADPPSARFLADAKVDRESLELGRTSRHIGSLSWLATGAN